MSKKPASKLGRGLSALMEDISIPLAGDSEKPTVTQSEQLIGEAAKAPKSDRGIHSVAIDKLERNPDQPRRFFDKTLLEELTNSIRDKGVLQPILVRPLPRSFEAKGIKTEGRYQIVAGERRWQASVNAGLEFMPVLVRELNDQEVLEIGVVENVQRADLNPVEEAMAYQALKDQFGRKQEDIAKAIGKSRSHVANCLRLLSLPVLAREYLADGKISAGHARAILSAPDPQALAEAIVSKNLSVRDAENWAHMMQKAARDPQPETKRKDADTRFIETQLAEHLGLKVKLNHKNPTGTMTIKYKTLEELEGLIARLRQS
ncbi:MAG: chromosome partitioning protein ParB [Robiginitomaculum sp.]|nr:MAG: chromosome partitioning protein ParB [Robiginitomaculum sp.]